MSNNASTTGSARIVQLKILTEEQLEHITNILVEAFKGDPSTLILLGNDLTLAPTFFGANVRAALIDGAIHVLTVGPWPEDIRGVAVWYPSSKSLFSSTESRASGWDQFLASVPKELRVWWLDYFGPRMEAFSNTALGSGKALSSWHLHLFAVRPGYQDRGIGRKLIEYAENLARKDRAPMILETTTDVNVKIYSKLGFRVSGETSITSPSGEARVRLMIKSYVDDAAEREDRSVNPALELVKIGCMPLRSISGWIYNGFYCF